MDYADHWNLSSETILKMLSDRGYKFDDSKFKNFLTEKVVIIDHSGRNHSTYVLLDTIEKKSVNLKKVIAENVKKNKINSIPDINENHILFFTTSNKKYETSGNIEIINMDEWFYNPMDHIHQPTFSILTSEEKSTLFRMYQIKESNLPKIDSKDRVSKYYGAKIGDIFKIERNTEMNGTQLYYRIVK
jgi:DNA-directed RNA polymerase subunit H (RpoH/RPB5)